MSYSRTAAAIRQYNGKLTPSGFAVLMCLTDHENDATGACYPGTRIMAEECGIDERSVRRAVKELVDRGVVSVERTYWRGSYREKVQYHFLFDKAVASNQDCGSATEMCYCAGTHTKGGLAEAGRSAAREGRTIMSMGADNSVHHNREHNTENNISVRSVPVIPPIIPPSTSNEIGERKRTDTMKSTSGSSSGRKPWELSEPALRRARTRAADFFDHLLGLGEVDYPAAFFDPAFDPVTMAEAITDDFNSHCRWRQFKRVLGEEIMRLELSMFYESWRMDLDMRNPAAVLNTRLAERAEADGLVL